MPALVTLTDIVNRGFVFFLRGFVDAVELVFTAADTVGWHHQSFETVDFLEFVGLCVRRSRHAAQLFIEAEIVLEGDGSHGLVFRLNRHTFFGFYRLVQSVTPTAACHQSSRELVDDHNLAVLVHIVLVAVVEVVGAQSRIQVVHQTDVRWVIQRCARGQETAAIEQTLRFLVALLR